MSESELKGDGFNFDTTSSVSKLTLACVRGVRNARATAICPLFLAVTPVALKEPRPPAGYAWLAPSVSRRVVPALLYRRTHQSSHNGRGAAKKGTARRRAAALAGSGSRAPPDGNPAARAGPGGSRTATGTCPGVSAPKEAQVCPAVSRSAVNAQVDDWRRFKLSIDRR